MSHSSESDPLLLHAETGATSDESSSNSNSSRRTDEPETTTGGDDFDDEDECDSSTSTASLWCDAKDTVMLGIPIFLATLSWVGMKTTDTALLGHVSPDALSAAALSDLWTMCTQVFVQARVLGVLVGAAVGAGNPKLGGVYLQVSYVVLACVTVVVFILWNLTEYVWIWFGSVDHSIAKMAGYYARVLSFSLPGQLALSQLTQFFSSQRIMQPEVNAASVALALNLLLGLVFVLGVPLPGFDGFGFEACPIVTTAVVYMQLFVLWFFYIHRQRLHEAAWGGWDLRKELSWGRVRTFLELYVPSALGMASDYWRVAVIGGVAASAGELEVAVFNTSYRIMWIVMTAVNALASASAIKMSIRLGKLNPKGAKQAGEMGILLAAVILVIIGGAVYWQNRWFGVIFSPDEEFLALFESARLPFTVTLVLMNLSVAIERIPYAMGRTREVFWVGFVASWFAQVPGVLLLTRFWRNDLVGLYWGTALGYSVLAILYSRIVLTSDWKKYAEIARQRSEVSSDG